MSARGSSLQRWFLQRALDSRGLPPLDVALWSGVEARSVPWTRAGVYENR
jgi:hypothetical protein